MSSNKSLTMNAEKTFKLETMEESSFTADHAGSQPNHGSSSRGLSSASSAHNTDADDSDSDAKKHQKDRRRERHTKAEQMRRDQIKKGYDDLVALVPTLNGLMMDGETPATADLVSTKPSKAAILQRSIDYVQWLEKESKRQEEDVEVVRREVTGLKIMKDHYQQMINEAKQAEERHVQSQRNSVAVQEAKFTIFKEFMESLFASFDPMVGVTSFVELSSGVIRWLEEHCAPQLMHQRLSSILQQLFTRPDRPAIVASASAAVSAPLGSNEVSHSATDSDLS